MEAIIIANLQRELESERLKNKSLDEALRIKTLENKTLKSTRVVIDTVTTTDEASTKTKGQLIGVLDIVINRLFGSYNIYEIAQEISDILSQFLGTNDCVIYAVYKDKNHLEQIAASGRKLTENGEIINKLLMPIGEGIVGSVAKSGKSELIHDTSKDDRYIEDIETRFSELTVPIILNGHVIGIIDSEHPDKNFFTRQQLKTVESIAKVAALKVKHALDMREKDQSDRDLITSQKRLYSLISGLDTGILLEDENRKIILTNQRFCNFFQIPLSPEYLIGQDCSNAAEQSKHLFKNPEHFTERIAQLLEKREKAIADEVIMANNTILERDYIPIFNDDEYLGHLWSYRDVTLNRNYQKSLEAQREKYSNIISNMNLGLIEVDNNDVILMVNKSFEQMSGYKEYELIGKTGADILLDEASKKMLKAQVDNRVKGESNIYEVTAKNKENADRYWLISGAPNYNINDEIIGSIGIHLDITKQKKLEIQKENLLEKLKKSNEELEEYAHIVSHDLKSPLRNISALANWIKTDNLSKLKPESIQHFKQLELTLEKMDTLISGILKYASISEETVLDHNIDLNELLDTILQTIHIPQNISITIKQTLPTIIVDRMKARQIFQNLIMNAIEHNDKPQGIITIDFSEQEKHYEFSVSDNGVGIDEKYHKKIFKIFNSIHQKSHNSGIGLSIVKKILNIYNCTIRIESELGVGTTFFFTLNK
tara:strand:+ start:255118 stop:257256 length:2139 start_codon:yes stop_codon:yes gene_type:complete